MRGRLGKQFLIDVVSQRMRALPIEIEERHVASALCQIAVGALESLVKSVVICRRELNRTRLSEPGNPPEKAR
jgi:hypothetical protein